MTVQCNIMKSCYEFSHVVADYSFLFEMSTQYDQQEFDNGLDEFLPWCD